MDRSAAETAGWVFVADQDKYVRAEKLLPNGDLINMQGEDEGLVVDQIAAWESYPVQAPNTRTNDLGPDTADVAPVPEALAAPLEAPAESGVDVPVTPLPDPVPAPPPDGEIVA